MVHRNKPLSHITYTLHVRQWHLCDVAALCDVLQVSQRPRLAVLVPQAWPQLLNGSFLLLSVTPSFSLSHLLVSMISLLVQRGTLRLPDHVALQSACHNGTSHKQGAPA